MRLVKAHTGNEDSVSRLNDLADSRPPRAHLSVTTVVMPAPDRLDRRYVPYVQTIGYMPDNWQSHYASAMTQAIFDSQPAKLKQRLRNAADADCAARYQSTSTVDPRRLRLSSSS